MLRHTATSDRGVRPWFEAWNKLGRIPRLSPAYPGRSPISWEEPMKAIHWITTAAALAFIQPAPASATQFDPEIVIYRFPGVLDDGDAAVNGVATVFHCTNFSGVTENVRFATR